LLKAAGEFVCRGNGGDRLSVKLFARQKPGVASGMGRTMETRESHPDTDRRALLQTAGRLAVVVPPAMTLLLSTSMSSPAIAASGSFTVHGNNGVGNGLDPQPPGNPPINDGPGTGPGDPGNKGGTPSGH
jgi:hypothetical protein